MQRLGQHFLKNEGVSKKIAAALELKRGEKVVEIGPGHGELTKELLKTGAEVFSIEKDLNLAHELESEIKNENFKLYKGDALKLLPEITKDIPNYKLTGNIPYYITGFLLRTIGELENKPDLSVFMLQKEVAERLTSAPPKMNRLAASVGFWADARILFNVSKKSFSPPPKVDSAVILMVSKPEEGDKSAYYSLVRTLFKQPRKTIWNNLRDAEFKNTEDALKKLEIDSGERPQNLSIANIIQISKYI